MEMQLGSTQEISSLQVRTRKVLKRSLPHFGVFRIVLCGTNQGLSLCHGFCGVKQAPPSSKGPAPSQPTDKDQSVGTPAPRTRGHALIGQHLFLGSGNKQYGNKNEPTSVSRTYIGRVSCTIHHGHSAVFHLRVHHQLE